MNLAESNNLPGQLMLVDFHKAFDSVSWKCLTDLLNYLNFGLSFCRWITMFNSNIKAYIVQSGFLSEAIKVEKGCKQGDPIASYLFLLAAQVLFYMTIM